MIIHFQLTETYTMSSIFPRRISEMSIHIRMFSFIAVTEEEIQHGLLQTICDVNKKCLCFIRKIENLEDNKDHHRAVKFLDLIPGGL